MTKLKLLTVALATTAGIALTSPAFAQDAGDHRDNGGEVRHDDHHDGDRHDGDRHDGDHGASGGYHHHHHHRHHHHHHHDDANHG